MTHPKRPRDPNQLAKSIIDIATGQGVGELQAEISIVVRQCRIGKGHSVSVM